MGLQLAALDEASDKVFRCAVQLLKYQGWSRFDAQLEVRLDRDWHGLSDQRRMALLTLKPVWQQLQYLLRHYDHATVEVDEWAESNRRLV